MPPQRILYIGGLGRSGSTLLSLLLNSLPGFVAVGEIRYIWLHAEQDLLCSCGERFHACEFWTAVGKHAFGGWHRIDPQRIIATLSGVDRHRYIPLLLRPALVSSFDSRLREYRQALSRLYRAVSTVSGQRVIVDSTKEPPFALVVRGLPTVDFRLVHLVRDSRGVAYSWMKQTPRPEVTDHVAMMNRYTPLSASLRWIGSNLLCHLAVSGAGPRLMARYEELVNKPTDVLARIVSHAGENLPFEDLAALLNGERPLCPSHSIAGNPVRFDRRALRLRIDDEWVTNMRPRDRVVVSTLTMPLMWRYGYNMRVAPTVWHQ